MAFFLPGQKYASGERVDDLLVETACLVFKVLVVFWMLVWLFVTHCVHTLKANSVQKVRGSQTENPSV